MADIDRIVLAERPGVDWVFFLAAGRVVEIWLEPVRADHADTGVAPGVLGGIALARVRSLVKGLDAAIVDIPGGQAFVRDLPKGKAKPTEGTFLPVQVVREALTGKHPVARSAIELVDGELMLTPAQPGIGLSSRITGKARRAAIKASLKPVVPDDLGVLVRGGAGDREPTALAERAKVLVSRWRSIEAAATAEAAPAWLLPPPKVGELARAHAPGLKLERDSDGRLWREIDAAAVVERALARRVTLEEGVTLTIDPAEAATLIDVDIAAGKLVEANRRAGRAALAEMRLRGLRGTILLDLPRMPRKADREKLVETIREAAAADPAPVQVLGWTPGGILELTREGARRPLHEVLQEADRKPTPRAAAWAALAGLDAETRAIARPVLLVAEPVARWLAGPGAPLVEAARRRLGALTVRPDPGCRVDEYRVISEV